MAQMGDKKNHGEDNIQLKYIPSDSEISAVESIRSDTSCLLSESLDSAHSFFGARNWKQYSLITEEFDPSSSQNCGPRADMISELWPYYGPRVLDQLFQRIYDENSSLNNAPSWEIFCKQNPTVKMFPEVNLFDQISSHLEPKKAYEEFSDDSVSWLQKNIRTLFDSMSHSSASVAELNLCHPEVHFVGSSFIDPMCEVLSAVMVSSRTNAQIVFLKDIAPHPLIPFDSVGLRNWIIELPGKNRLATDRATQELSNVEASSLLLLIEFVLHCDCGVLLRQHRRRVMRLLQKISAEHHILPPSLELQDIEPSKHPFGGGGYSDVFERTWNGTTVCVKRLRIYFRPEKNALEAEKAKVAKAFLKEALIWKQLKHSNILPFVGVSSTCFPNQISLVSPYMKNGDIMCYISKHSLDQAPTYDQRLRWLLGTARAIQYIHSMNLYHGDIKGANILIDEHTEARLADLGISSVVVSASETLGWGTSTAGNVKGSLRWMSPEVIMNSESSRTTARDIYAFGSTILEVVTGQYPWFNIREDAMVILNLSQGKHPDRPDGFGNDVWSIIESCWTRDPIERPSAKAVLERCRLSLSMIGRTFRPSSSLDDICASARSGKEADQTAQVLKVYLDDAESYDYAIIQRFRDTLDSTLVSATLFSAVIITFAILARRALPPDNLILTAQVRETLLLLRSATAITTTSPPGHLSEPSIYSTRDVRTTALLFISLVLSGVDVLASALAKLRLQNCTAKSCGTVKKHMLTWHCKFAGAVEWRFENFVAALPLVLCCSFGIFAIDFSLFIYSHHKPMPWDTTVNCIAVFFLSIVAMSSCALHLENSSALLNDEDGRFGLYARAVRYWAHRFIECCRIESVLAWHIYPKKSKDSKF
ncbi:kinase-like domain-containing protein [Flagelloscypha sp. PMI_526]|nr:kinase-like domain-containing protein [Flagelloscypha sp. PMI_526]